MKFWFCLNWIVLVIAVLFVVWAFVNPRFKGTHNYDALGPLIIGGGIGLADLISWGIYGLVRWLS
ncbi:hypothetical protein [Maridesulfovibrio sp.]|uniref:hypothetical protein n=1 Tax=Maridesulfovibrio sp. TaxID=2795000 RepID=UPI002A18DA41|nr:hypothetical protein [Maridesulfovibrio sp.]